MQKPDRKGELGFYGFVGFPKSSAELLQLYLEFRAALPSDVRKVYDVYDLPMGVKFIWGYAPLGAQPQ